MAPKKSTELSTTKASTGMSLPSHIKAGTRGAEKLTSKDVTLPFLKLGQDKSPQVIQELVDQGNWFNSVTNEQFGKEVEIIVVAAVTGMMRFGEYGKKEGILCQAPDGVTALAMAGEDANGKPTNKCADCVLGQWGKDGEKPACMKQGRFLVFRPGTQEPMLLTLQSTNYGAARKINGMISGQYDAFAHVIKLTWARGDKAPKISAQKAGWASEGDYAFAERLYESAKAMFFGGRQEGIGAAD